MRYRFPVYARGQNGPIELSGDCEACQNDERVLDVATAEDLPGWMYTVEACFDSAAKRAMRQAAEQVGDEVDVIVPWTADRLPVAPGCNEHEMAVRMFHAGEGVVPHRVEGNGRVLGAMMYRRAKYGSRPWVAMRAPGAWTRALESAVQPYDPVEPLARKVASYLKPTQRQVVFMFREFPICGVTLAATHICNGLNRLGWNATIACTSLDPVQAKLFPFEFGPMVFKGLDEMARALGNRTDKTSVVVAPVHALVDTAVKVSENSGADLVYYVQDDERRFRQTSGEPYYKAEAIEAGWAKAAGVGRLVANSNWVADMLKGAGHAAGFVPIGVDTDVFKPGDRSKPPFRIMAHCRPSTPRRGWGFIAAVLNQLTIRGLDFEAVTYDERPLGLEVRQHRDLGRLSPQQVAQEMSQAHMFVEGSDVQGFGMQALEAMSSGCALVCTANKGIDTFGDHGNNCVIVRHGDVGGAADEIMKLATHLDLRVGFGRNAREQALKFEWREVSKAWDRVLHERSASNDEAHT